METKIENPMIMTYTGTSPNGIRPPVKCVDSVLELPDEGFYFCVP